MSTKTVPEFARLPWVHPLREPSLCAARVSTGRHCRTPARWSYTFLPTMGDPADVYDGDTVPFCTIHLLREVFRYELRETRRCYQWFEEHQVPRPRERS